MPQYDINLRDYWRIIRKRKGVILFTTLLLAFFSFVFSKFNEPIPIYSAVSSVRIERTTSIAGLIMQSFTWSPADDLATQQVIIRSFPVMEEVAKELGYIDKSLSSAEVSRSSQLVSIINGLQDQVSTFLRGTTNIIDIRVTSRDPEESQHLANTIAQKYKEHTFSQRNKQVIETRKFIEEQLTQAEKRLRVAENSVKEFQEANKLLSLSSEASAVLSRVARAEGEYEQLKERLGETRLQLKQLEANKPLERGGRLYVETPGSVIGRLNQNLADKQAELEELLLDYTEQHPQVQEGRLQIRNIIDNMKKELVAQEATLARRVERVKSELDRLTSQNTALPAKGLELARLERDVKVNTDVFTLLRSKLEEARIREAGVVEEVSIVRPAFRPTRPDNPPTLVLDTAVGFLLGLMVGLVFAFVLEAMDTSIGAIEDVESYLETPVLGILPQIDPELMLETYLKERPERSQRFSPDTFARMVTHFAPRSPMAEAYRALRTQMEFLTLEKGGKSFVITSSSPGEGKTSAAINLAIAYAQAGKRTLLLEGDLRKPSIYRTFGIHREPGLTEVLLASHNWQDCVQTVTDIMVGRFDIEDILITPGLDKLSILTCGQIPPNPSEILDSNRMVEFIEDIRKEFDIVIIDTPPVLPVTDAAIIGSKVDGTVIVYKVGFVARSALKRAKLQLDNVRSNVRGVVLNHMRAELSPDIDTFKYYSHYYYGSYGAQPSEVQGYEPRYRRLLKRLIPKRPFGRLKEVKEGTKAKPPPSSTEGPSPAGRSLRGDVIRTLLMLLAIISFAAGLLWHEGFPLPKLGSKLKPYRRVETWPPRKPLVKEAPERMMDSNPVTAPIRVAEAGQKNGAAGGRERSEFRAESNPGGLSQAHPFRAVLPTHRVEASPSLALQEEREPSALSLPYVLVISTNRLKGSAIDQMALLRGHGHEAHFTLFRAGRRPWYRVFLGPFPTIEEAKGYRENHFVRGRNGGDRGEQRAVILALPYSLELDAPSTPQGVESLKEEILEAGASLFSLSPTQNNKRQRLAAGAFRTEEEAQALSNLLQEKGLPHFLVRR